MRESLTIVRVEISVSSSQFCCEPKPVLKKIKFFFYIRLKAKQIKALYKITNESENFQRFHRVRGTIIGIRVTPKRRGSHKYPRLSVGTSGGSHGSTDG